MGKTRNEPQRKQPPARTLEAREHQMTSLAMDLAERRILDGTASAQEVVHFLRLGTVQHQMERQKLKTDIELTLAKVEQIQTGDERAQIAQAALEAMRRYKGIEDEAEEIIG